MPTAPSEPPPGRYQFPVSRVRILDPAELDARLKSRVALDPSVFEESPPFFLTAVVSTDEVDTYFTRMAESTLRNFAADAEAGVSLMIGHDVMGRMPVGRSLAGQFEEGTPSQVSADFFILTNHVVDGRNTNDIIKSIRAGAAKDVSIGFYGGMYRCSICARDMLRDWDCRHYPGMSYDVLDAKGNVVGSEVAIAWVEGSHMSETSLVYDGACPSAAVVKALERATGGQIPETAISLLEERYRISLPRAARSFPAADPAGAQKEPPMLNDPTSAAGADETSIRLAADLAALQRRVAEFGASCARFGLQPDKDRDPLEWATAELARVQPIIADGRAYREATIDEAIRAGVAAIGEEFDEAGYRAMFEHSELRQVVRLRDDWRAIAERVLPSGRHTIDQPTTVANGTARAGGRRSARGYSV